MTRPPRLPAALVVGALALGGAGCVTTEEPPASSSEAPARPDPGTVERQPAPPDADRAGKHSTEEAPAAWRYRVGIDPALSTLTTTLCFHGRAPEPGELVPGEPECGRYLMSAELLRPGGEPQPLAIEAGGARVRLPRVPDGACVRFVVDAERAAREADSDRVAERVGRDLVTSPDLWLYRPRGQVRGVPMRARFDLPPGIAVSTAWPKEGDAYVVRPTVWRWLNRVVFGRFAPLEVEVPGGVVEVAVLDGPRRLDDGEVKAWIARSAGAVSRVYGRFPRERAQVTVTPVASWGEDAVPFGRVIRGGGGGVHLLLASNARWPADFDDDWVSVHEMSHLTTPFLRQGGRWLSEGVATYYQNVLRARAGLISEEQAWQKLHEGFERGRRSGRAGLTLREAVGDMWSSRNFLRVYWAGTFWALASDLRLRTRERPSSLDEALSRFEACCLDGLRSWSDLTFLRRLDQEVGGTVMVDLAEELLPAEIFPDPGPLYEALGVEIRGGRVRLGGGPEEEALRRAIMGPAPLPGEGGRR